MLWLATGALVVTGVVASAAGVLLPESEKGWRTAATALGVLLVAFGGIYGSYGVTKSVTSKESEAAYNEFLAGVARSIAHVYSTLHQATYQRRSQAFVHEETYQESVILAAEALLTQFDGITSVSGAAGTGLVDSKKELQSIRQALYVDEENATVTAVTSLERRTSHLVVEPVQVRCPSCDMRTNASLALRVGWTRSIRCESCGARFNIHRKPDMSVYTSGPLGYTKGVTKEGRNASMASVDSTGTEEKGGEVPEIHEAGLDAAVLPEVSDGLARCPSCHESFSIHRSKASADKGRGLLRTCLRCKLFLHIDYSSLEVRKTEPGSFSAGIIAGRQGPYPQVHCPIDDHLFKASFHVAEQPDWYGVCPVHRQIMGVSRSTFRVWLSENEPEYLKRRLDQEAQGGRAVVSDLST